MNNISMVNKSSCFSCRACLYSCSKGAIEMKEMKGFFYPEINQNCIDCGLCLRVCPTKNKITVEKQISKAIYLKDEQKLKESTSGGAFAGFAEYILEKKGVVFGAAYDDDLNVNQIYVEDVKDLIKLKGSKYVESFTNDSYAKVKEFLEQDRYVLYSGTPCQIAGLKSFLKNDYEKLITLDLICHGVPSRRLFKKYLDWLGKKLGGKIIYYGFRDKDVAGWSCGGKVKTKTKTKTKTIETVSDPYYASFLRGETYRESCYTCPYSSLNRPGDITIGDFWGVKEIYPEYKNENGISCCIINTEKGKYFFERCVEKFESYDAELNSILLHNPNLQHPTKRPCKRDNLYDDFDNLTIKKFSKKFKEANNYWKLVFYLKKLIVRIFPNSFIRIIKKIIGR